MSADKYDRQRALAECIAKWVAAGYSVESHDGNMAVLVQNAPTVGQGFAKAGLIGMMSAARKARNAERVTLYADETEIRRL